MIKFYGLKQCSTCQKAVKWFEDQDIHIDSYLDIKSQVPETEELQKALKAYGDQPQKIMNTSGQLYRDMDLKNRLDDMDTEEMIQLLSKNGMLVKRPFISDGERVSVGAKFNDLEERWTK